MHSTANGARCVRAPGFGTDYWAAPGTRQEQKKEGYPSSARWRPGEKRDRDRLQQRMTWCANAARAAGHSACSRQRATRTKQRRVPTKNPTSTVPTRFRSAACGRSGTAARASGAKCCAVGARSTRNTTRNRTTRCETGDRLRNRAEGRSGIGEAGWAAADRKHALCNSYSNAACTPRPTVRGAYAHLACERITGLRREPASWRRGEKRVRDRLQQRMTWCANAARAAGHSACSRQRATRTKQRRAPTKIIQQ
jgi:hypothetical protein